MEEESDGSIHSNLLVSDQAEQSDKTNINQADSPIKRSLNKHIAFYFRCYRMGLLISPHTKIYKWREGVHQNDYSF